MISTCSFEEVLEVKEVLLASSSQAGVRVPLGVRQKQSRGLGNPQLN